MLDDSATGRAEASWLPGLWTFSGRWKVRVAWPSHAVQDVLTTIFPGFVPPLVHTLAVIVVGAIAAVRPR